MSIRCHMLTEQTITEENVRIRGRGRMLDGVLSYPTDQASFSSLIAGPHPFLGGDMRNNVVSSLSKALALRGAVTLAFDYGGVGGSEGGPADWPAVMSKFWKEGAFDEENDWADDTGSAIDSLRQSSDFPPVLVGYSFGCWTVVKNLEGSCAKAVVLVSPNPKQHEFEQLSKFMAPLLVIHSDNDFTCGVSEMTAWFDSIREPKKRIQLPASEHFFRGHETEVAKAVLEFLQQHQVLGAGQHVNGH